MATIEAIVKSEKSATHRDLTAAAKKKRTS